MENIIFAFFIIVLVLPIGFLPINKRIMNYFEKEIAKQNNVKDAISIRKKAKHIQKTYYAVVLLLVVSLLFLLLDYNEKSSETIYKFLWFYFFYYSLITSFFRKSFKKISIIKEKDIHSYFVLYLRGFEDDDYSSAANILTNNIFSEYKMAQSLLDDIPVYAVGMSKELDQPLGCDRIYFEDSDWKNGVLKLMEKASYIIILVNDRDSCIWEIKQSIPFLSKTIFIIDNIDRYYLTREKLKGDIDFPLTNPAETGHSFILRLENNKYVTRPMDLSLWSGDYKLLANLIKNNCQLPPKFNRLTYLFYYILFIVSTLGCVVCLGYLIYYIILPQKNEGDDLLDIFMSMILYSLFSWCLYDILKKRIRGVLLLFIFCLVLVIYCEFDFLTGIIALLFLIILLFIPLFLRRKRQSGWYVLLANYKLMSLKNQ